MAKTNNLTDFLTDVADAIREKEGSSGLINPQDFSAKIRAIQGGGESGGGESDVVAAPENDVNFRDYDGTILYSYSKDEFLALTGMPKLPTQKGLICQEWNCSLEDAKAYVSECGILEISATYITDDGKTRLYVNIPDKGRKWAYVFFQQSISNGVIVDWGDGNQETFESITSSKLHKYAKGGDYVITLNPQDGCVLNLGNGTEGYNIMGSVKNGSFVFSNTLNRAEIGKNVTSIKAYAFNKCYSLKHIIIPKEVESIGNYAFSESSVSHITIPRTVQNIGTSAFGYCSSLQRVSLSEVTSPFGLSYCKSLKKICLIKVSALEDHVFNNCVSLPFIIFPKSLESIKANAFVGCYGIQLYDFRSLEKVPQLSSTNAFSNTYKYFKIVVPDALYDEWIAATNWTSYASKIVKASEYTQV